MKKPPPGLIRPIQYDRNSQADYRTSAETAENTDSVAAAFERGELTQDGSDG